MSAVLADATIDASLQMQLGNPSNASADTNNHSHYLIERSIEALDYNDTLGQPNWASWDLTAGDANGTVDRQDAFAADTNLPSNFHVVGANDYSHSGYDRGHLCPSADRSDSTNDNDLTFLMSNMMPQSSDNNEVTWAGFENYCRSLCQGPDNDELLIICGPSGFTGAKINTNGYVSIPQFTWKIAVVVPPGSGAAINRITATNRVIAIKVPNTNGISSAWQNFITSASQIQADTGLAFFTALPPEVAAALRAKVDGQTYGILAGWDTSTQTGTGLSPFAPNTNGPNLAVAGLTRGIGVKTASKTGGWGGAGFTNLAAATAIASNQVFTFSIAASNGYNLSFTAISQFDYYRSSTGPTNGVLQFQVAGGAFTDITNLAYPVSGGGASIGAIDLSGFAALQNVGANTNVTFRIVNWNGGPSGTWYVYDTAGTTAPDLAVQGVVTQVLNAPAVAPWFSLLAFTGKQFQFTIGGTAGSNYVVQAATNLTSPAWVSMATNPAPFGFAETNANLFPQRFYRAVVAP